MLVVCNYFACLFYLVYLREASLWVFRINWTVLWEVWFKPGVPNLSLTMYPFSILPDKHVPLKFLIIKRLSKISISNEFLIYFYNLEYLEIYIFFSLILLTLNVSLQIGKCTPSLEPLFKTEWFLITFHLPYFSDHKVHLKSFHFSKIWSVSYNAVCLMYESGCAFSPRTNLYMINGAIYSIASYNFFVNSPLCYVINQQQLQWAAHVVPWVASTYLNVEAHIVLFREATAHSFTLGGSWLHWHTPSHTHAQLLVYSIRV